MNALTVITGSRLHFGLLLGREGAAWNFGGPGLMVRQPGWSLRLEKASGAGDEVVASPEARIRILQVLDRLRQIAQVPALQISVRSEIPFHTGLGGGTQLALAIAGGVQTLLRCSLAADGFQLARLAGRAERSAIGTSGFEGGGFLVDYGTGRQTGRVERLSIPDAWRFLLVRPEQGQGISGAQEQAFFSQRREMPDALMDELVECLMKEIVPSIRTTRFVIFAEQLERYGDLVGQFYALAQGDVFANPAIRKLVQQLRSLKISGAAQSSWGPGICIPADSDLHAQEIRRQIPEAIDGVRMLVTITEPLNTGATLLTPGPELRDDCARV